MDHQHKDANIILTQRVRLGMDGYITQRNMNVLVVGGSGSGKTRFFASPIFTARIVPTLSQIPKGSCCARRRICWQRRAMKSGCST